MIAVSEFTKRELVDAARRPRGADRGRPERASRTSSRPDGPQADGDYVLAVGTLEPRKNLERIARAVDGELRVVGARGWGGVEAPAERHVAPDASDDELAALYRGARCLVYASLYEGFGIPVAEALACGCPIVTTAGSPMAELAGGDAVVVDPTDVAAIADAIARAVAPLPRRVARWDDVAAQHAAVYEEASRDPHRRRRPRSRPDRRGDVHREPPARAAAVAPDLQFAAVTRHPELVPDGVEAIALPGALPGGADGGVAPAASAPARAASSRTSSTRCRSCYGGRSIVTLHDLHFERDPSVMGARRPPTFRAVVPRSARKADHVLAVSERTKRDAVELYGARRRTGSRSRRSAVDPAFTPGDGTHDGFLLFVGAVQARKDPLAALDAAQAVGLPLVVVGPEKEPALAAELRRRGADVRGSVPQGGARGAVPAGRRAPAAVALRGLRHPGARGDGERHAGRALGRSRAARGRRRRRRLRACAVAEALADRDRYRAAGLERAAQFSWRRTAELTVAAYRKVLAA